MMKKALFMLMVSSVFMVPISLRGMEQAFKEVYGVRFSGNDLALYNAYVAGDIGKFKELIQNPSFDPKKKLMYGYGWLQFGLVLRSLEVIKALVEAGVPINTVDHQGMTPLDMAKYNLEHAIGMAFLEQEHRAIAVYLVSKGAK